MTCDFFQTFNMQRTLAVIHPPNFQVLFLVRFFSVFFMYSISSNEIAGTNTHDRIALDKHLMFDKKKRCNSFNTYKTYSALFLRVSL